MAYLLRGKKGDWGTLETVGAIIIVIIFVLLITGGGQQLWASFKDTTSKVRSCEGMGFANGVCVAENEIVDCSVQIPGLGCKGNQPICCFKDESKSPGSIGSVTLLPYIELTPTSLKSDSSFIVSCNTNVQARGCVVVDLNNNLWICKTETWTSFTDASGTKINQVQFSCPAPTQAGEYQVKCRLDVNKCSPLENGARESNTATLKVE